MEVNIAARVASETQELQENSQTMSYPVKRILTGSCSPTYTYATPTDEKRGVTGR